VHAEARDLVPPLAALDLPAREVGGSTQRGRERSPERRATTAFQPVSQAVSEPARTKGRLS
jgi:hypothetical protein